MPGRHACRVRTRRSSLRSGALARAESWPRPDLSHNCPKRDTAGTSGARVIERRALCAGAHAARKRAAAVYAMAQPTRPRNAGCGWDVRSRARNPRFLRAVSTPVPRSIIGSHRRRPPRRRRRPGPDDHRGAALLGTAAVEQRATAALGEAAALHTHKTYRDISRVSWDCGLATQICLVQIPRRRRLTPPSVSEPPRGRGRSGRNSPEQPKGA